MRLIENEWFIQAPWGRICIVAWGNIANIVVCGGNCLNPPVLVLHGAADSLASFRPLLSLLPTNFYYVGFELPGQGRSDPYPPGLNISLMDLAHCIEIVRRHFRWEKFIFMGHSFAGTIGRLYNLAHPGRFVGAIELDQITPSLAGPLENLSKWFTTYYEKNYSRYHLAYIPQDERPSYSWDQAIQAVRNNRPELKPKHARATIERWSEPAGDGLIRYTFDPRWIHFVRPPFTPEQTKALFTSLSTPTLGIVSEDSVNQGKFRNTPFLLEDHGNYRVRKVQGGHDVHIAHPERVAPFVSQFLMYGLVGLDRKAKL